LPCEPINPAPPVRSMRGKVLLIRGPILNVLGSLDDSFLPVVVSRSIPFLSPSRRTIAEIVARDPVERLFELLRPRNRMTGESELRPRSKPAAH